ncbi:MAG: ABC transporter ATP-binding protein [Chloroflexi bacterium]|nr:ABC transporter ATP-binding protein [Chloroflexota bacterium]
MQLAETPALDAELARDSTQRRGLIFELIAYLQHRQAATGVSVTQHARQTTARAVAIAQRHGDVLARLARIEGRLRRLDAQVHDLRLLTETLRVPASAPLTAPPNGPVPNGHVVLEPEAPRAHGPALLRVEGLAKEIAGADILRDITFDVYQGEILGLIGPNGAGKTTLMECLAGMRPRSGGTFFIGDEAPPAWDPKDLLFYLPNNVLPYAELYTLEVLEFFGRLYEVEPRRWEQIVMRELSLGPALGKRVSALSKGNMQRLLIALALMSPQPLLALDEPFDGLDLHQTQAMMGILRGLRAQSRTLLLCIHQLNDAERICDRFLLLSTGRLVGVGTLTELRAQTGLSAGSLEEIFLALT